MIMLLQRGRRLATSLGRVVGVASKRDSHCRERSRRVGIQSPSRRYDIGRVALGLFQELCRAPRLPVRSTPRSAGISCTNNSTACVLDASNMEVKIRFCLFRVLYRVSSIEYRIIYTTWNCGKGECSYRYHVGLPCIHSKHFSTFAVSTILCFWMFKSVYLYRSAVAGIGAGFVG